MRSIIATATVELKRFLRDRSNVFFVFIFPLLLVLVIGSQFGGGAGGSVTVAGSGNLTTAVTTELEDGDLNVHTTDADEARDQVVRGRTDIALVITPEAEQAYQDGSPAQVQMYTGSAARASASAQEVRTAVLTVQLEQTQRLTLEGEGFDPADVENALASASDTDMITVEWENTDPLAQEFDGAGVFDVGAASQLLLFTFLSTLAGSATLIEARRHKVISRAMSTPTTAGRLILGQAAGRWTIAVTQGAYIMIATGVLFGVSWGNWGLSLLVLAVFAAVAAGAAMVLGAALDHVGAASGIGVGLGLVLAGIGGGMAPLEIFSDTMRTVAKVTPHSWAYEALADIQRRDAGLIDIAGNLGVLALFAAVLLALGGWLLRRSMERAL